MAALLTPPVPPVEPVETPRHGPTRMAVSTRSTSSARRPGRDVFVDAVRALATVGIVAVHWLMPEATFDGQTLWIGNALAHGGGWTLTWVLQVLPLLFFAAGASAAYQHARHQHARLPYGSGWAGVVGARLRGVARPVAAFAGAWALTLGVLLASGLPDQAVLRLARMAPQLLWFLAVWVALVACTPLARAAWRRWRWAAVAVAVAAPLVVDLLRFGAGLEPVAWANVLLVWAVPFLLGVAYADDRSHRVIDGGRPAVAGRPVLVAVLVLAVGAMAALVRLGPYPVSMIGMPGDAVSNLAPPTAVVVAQSIAQVAAVLLARDAIVRWACGRGRDVVRVLTRRALTVYLWHLTAMFVVVGAVLLGLHARLPEPWSTDWWSTRPVWWGAFGLVLLGLVRVFGRFEVPRGRRAQRVGSPIA
ncbi:hypothetical protein Xcel_2523 [Xylanimonas cellulosilytica DSM 15894]|uniref:Acyltransferase 3 domain-containing protein n=1 Tax=Xylanimonas cellulosilytica (strain DSM 15894 / JCM 12276 / CECT 5975 / KCTC 9989 / LMG 20990 / NBRC 107835 / XIL07) TaxID=446471 RepID=D1BWJ3_XYLCX|nr:acyltransferase family protein [Xylanimonas cellulosilytica]ACZ31538.1 hypothetical protein Xcel_2523 [Xylanimonas cellulosilytica DSM 15894]